MHTHTSKVEPYEYEIPENMETVVYNNVDERVPKGDDTHLTLYFIRKN